MTEEGMLPLLISLSNAPGEQLRRSAAFVLVWIALNPDLQNKITEEGGLQPALYLARTESNEINQKIICQQFILYLLQM